MACALSGLQSAAAAAPPCPQAHAGGVPPGRLAALSRGYNLAGWLDGPSGRPPDVSVVTSLRKRGFTHIRLPFGAERVMPRFTPRDEREARLAELDRALDVLATSGYAVIIDLAPGAEFTRLARNDPDAAQHEVEAAWLTLAARERRRSDDGVFFELLNEPPVDDAVWRAWLARLVPAIRRAAPRRTLIVGPAPYQRYDALTSWQPLSDPNVVYAVHFYDPMVFTHQGATWETGSPVVDLAHVPFPAAAGDRRIAALAAELESSGHSASGEALRQAYAHEVSAKDISASFAAVAAWSARHDRPVIVDEFGVLAQVAPPAARRAWIAAVRGAAEHVCFGWSHWEFSQGFGFVDPTTGRIDEGLVEALLGRPSRRPSTPR